MLYNTYSPVSPGVGAQLYSIDRLVGRLIRSPIGLERFARYNSNAEDKILLSDSRHMQDNGDNIRYLLYCEITYTRSKNS